jgi:hypothetical protein
VQEPDNPWSNIGYWGDHQVIYLAKLLELQNKFNRAGLLADLDRRCYSSGNVPYRLKPYADIVKNPRSTIIFDGKLHADIEKRVHEKGTDEKLLQTPAGEVALVSMTAKLLPVVLAKMANLVPAGASGSTPSAPNGTTRTRARRLRPFDGHAVLSPPLHGLPRRLYENAPVPSFAVPEETAAFFEELRALRLY